MNSTVQQSPKDLFSGLTDSTASPVVIEVSGIRVSFRVKGDPKLHWMTSIPSFKTQKTAVAWRDKVSGKIMARPLTQPHHKKWMELATISILSQLLSALKITDEKILTAAQPRSWIASLLPLDDAWTWCPELIVKSRLCRPGEEEGAEIRITRLT